MNELYQFAIGDAQTDFDKILMMTMFYIVFQGFLFMIVELVKIGKGVK